MVKVMESEITTDEIVPELLRTLKEFTGANYEQEDDITLVTLLHTGSGTQADTKPDWTVVAEFDIPSQPGNERAASEKALEALGSFKLDEAVNNRLQTAVAEATMNAMEHGNHYQVDLMVEIRVLTSPSALAVRIRDHGGGKPIPEPETPDLEAKLAGLQSPRGWGLFLIKNMVDEMNIEADEVHHTIELIFNLEGSHS